MQPELTMLKWFFTSKEYMQRLLLFTFIGFTFLTACEELKFFRPEADPAKADSANQPMPDPDLREYNLNSFSEEQVLQSSWFFWKPGIDKAEVLILLKKKDVLSQKLSDVKLQKAQIEQKRSAYLQTASGGQDPTTLSEEESTALLESTQEGQEIERTYNQISSNEQALLGQVAQVQYQLQQKTENLNPAQFALKTENNQLNLKIQGLEIKDANGNIEKDCSSEAHTILGLKYQSLGGKIQALILCQPTTILPANSVEYILLSIERIPSPAGNLQYSGNIVRCVDSAPSTYQIDKCQSPLTYGQIRLGN
jgi:hypothetical protein